MKFKLFHNAAALVILAATLFAPSASRAQSDTEAKTLSGIAQEVIAQQKTIAENQAKIDAKLAEIAEDVRVARIFVSRAGGKK